MLTLNLNKNKIYLFFILTLFIGVQSSAQIFNESGINIGIKAGGAKLISEYSGSFESIKEFTNKPGFVSGIEISKVVFPHFELGAEFSYSTLNGETDKTDHFSAIGYHYKFMEPLKGPTEYNNKLIGENLFLRYYFGEALNKTVLNPFIKVGFSYLYYKSTFKYVNSEEILFGKGSENQPDLSTGMFSVGTGFKTSLSDQVYLLTSIDFNMVKYDFLDVVHNYDNNGNRMNITGLYSELKIGIFYNSRNSGSISSSSGKRTKANRKAKYNNLPFAR